MNRRDELTEKYGQHADVLWRRLAATFELHEPPEAMSPGFADRVLRRMANVSDRHAACHVGQQQRLVSMAAVFALAASIVIALWSWQDLQAAWDPAPAIFEPVETMFEPADDLEPLS